MVLAIDPAATSGWSLWASGRYVSSGECGLKLADIARVVNGSLQFAEVASIPAVLVLERPFKQKPGMKYAASGQGRESWRGCWQLGGGVMNKIIQVYPSTWRAKVLPRGMANAKREVVRPEERKAAVDFVIANGNAPDDFVVGPDEAAAICLGRFAITAGEVGDVLAARDRVTV